MSEKVVYYNNLKFIRDAATGYYLNSTLRIRLHRYVWICEKGEIPKGYEVHHIDFDRSNNNISNLVCLSRSEHRKLHADALTDEQREWKRQNIINNAISKAKLWHSSEQGMAWHRNHANLTAMQEKVDKICIKCGTHYLAKSQSKFCSNKCKSAYRRAQQKDVTPMICEFCGKEFLANKYRPQHTCSKSCATKLQHKIRRYVMGAVGKPSTATIMANTDDNTSSIGNFTPNGQTAKDGSITMNYVHIINSTSQPKAVGDFGQKLEPAGEYMSFISPTQPRIALDNYIYGVIHFNNPLLIEYKNTSSTGWKKDLSEMFGGKTGKSLSNAIKKAGYDAVVTYDEYKGAREWLEIVNLGGTKL